MNIPSLQAGVSPEEWQLRFWERDGQDVAWAWLKLPNKLDYCVHPAHRADALHVFCYARKAFLVDYAIKHRGIHATTAEHDVEQRNKQRAEYVKRHWGRDWRSFENYHLCLDTGRLGIPGAADLVVAAARTRFSL